MTTATSVLNDVSRTIRRLAEVRLDEQVFITMYVSLDPSQFATARDRDAQIDSLIHELRTHDIDESVSHDARTAYGDDIERIHEWTKTELHADGARGVAIFCSSITGTFEIMRVSKPVGPSVHVDHTAQLEPLLAAIPTEAWCVLLINRRTARIFRGSRDGLDEAASVTDDVHGQHDQGGWSQKRYERSVEKEVTDHLQNGCNRLFEAFKQRPFDKLLLGCADELRPEVEATLHPYLVERLVGHFEGEVEHTNGAEVTERVQPLIEAHERRTESELIERLAEQLGRNERAVAGPGRVLQALNLKAVEILLLRPGHEMPGAVCPRCEWMDTAGGSCPVDDSTPLEAVENVVEWAVRSAVLQSADVHEVRYHEPDTAMSGPIAALLRFDVPDAS